MSQQTIQILLISLISIILIYEIFDILKKPNRETALKNKALELMLYAEKQDLLGEDKFKYVSKKIYEVCPDLVKKVIKEGNIEDWLNNLYTNFKINISNMEGEK